MLVYMIFNNVLILFHVISPSQQIDTWFFTVLSSFQGLKAHDKGLKHGEFVFIVLTIFVL